MRNKIMYHAYQNENCQYKNVVRYLTQLHKNYVYFLILNQLMEDGEAGLSGVPSVPWRVVRESEPETDTAPTLLLLTGEQRV